MFTVNYQNPMGLAQDIAKMLDSKKKRFISRPWNRFKPTESLWWVVPGTHWPAYSSGKYSFMPEGELIWCGINIEKGFGAKTALVYPQLNRRKLIADQDWIWHRFIKDLESQEVGRAISVVEGNSKEKVRLFLAAGLVKDPSDFDPDSPKADTLAFDVSGGDLSLVRNRLSNQSLQPLLNAQNLDGLFGLLSPDVLDWIWIDVYISVPFKIVKPGDASVLDAMDVFNSALRPFEEWIK